MRVDLLDGTLDNGQCGIRLPDKTIVRARTGDLREVTGFANPSAADLSLEGIAGAATRALSGYLAGPEQWEVAVPGALDDASKETFSTTLRKPGLSTPTVRSPGNRGQTPTRTSPGNDTVTEKTSMCHAQRLDSGDREVSLPQASQRRTCNIWQTTRATHGEQSTQLTSSPDAADSKRPANLSVRSGALAGKGDPGPRSGPTHGAQSEARHCRAGAAEATGAAAHPTTMAEALGDHAGVCLQPQVDATAADEGGGQGESGDEEMACVAQAAGGVRRGHDKDAQ